MPAAGITRTVDVRCAQHVARGIEPMPTKQKAQTAKRPKQRMQERRKRLCAQGLRPIQHWVPDLRNPRVRAEIRREAAKLPQHPDNAAIDKWIDAICDWSEWR
jgi:hypothetical protein